MNARKTEDHHHTPEQVNDYIEQALGIRIAGYHNTMKGWMYSLNPHAHDNRYGTEDDGARLTLKYDDPDIGIAWPDGLELIPSQRDATAPLLREVAGELPFVYHS